MKETPAVEVLLATFNGERFLRQQIDSILSQDYPNLRVLARDDGSGDGTAVILKEYSEAFPGRFRVMPPGRPTGSAKDNFLLLMQASSADYLCFSDQDDVWLPDKVSLSQDAMNELEKRWGKEIPLLVFSDLHVVDDRLETLHRSFWSRMCIVPERINRLSELLGKSVVTGCAAMLNRSLLDLSLRMPEDAFMHDCWVALLASTLGKSAIVRAQTVLYRQHGDNVVGTGIPLPGGESATLLNRVRRFPLAARAQLALWNVSQQQARAFLRVHGAELPAEKRELLGAYLRCETSKSRFVRVATFIRYRFFFVGMQQNLATILYLWNKRVEKPAG